MKTSETSDARKIAMKKKEAIELARRAEEIYTARGKKIIHTDLRKTKLSDDELAELLLGPTGNLRAPTARVGKTLIVGFDEETYKKVLS